MDDVYFNVNNGKSKGILKQKMRQKLLKQKNSQSLQSLPTVMKKQSFVKGNITRNSFQ
jgi:hypothetical protein